MKLIKLNTDHYIIVDDSEIKEDCWALHMGPLGEREIVTANGQCKLDKKITHSTQPLELLTLSENGLSGMGFSKVRPLNIFNVKELIGEVDVEKIAERKYPKSEFWIGSNPSRLYDENAKERRCFIEGYNQALEDNKERYKEIIQLIENITEWSSYKDHPIGKQAQKALELLQPKTEWEVEIVDGKLKLKLFH